MDKKRLIFAGIFFIVVLVLGYIMYLVFFAPKKPAPVTVPGEVITPGAFPPSGEGEPIRPGVTEPGVLPPSEVRPGVSFQPSAGITEIERHIVESPIVSPTIDSRGNAQFYNESDGKFYRLTSTGAVQELSDQVFFNVENVNWSPNNNESIIEYPDGSNIYYNFQTKRQVTLPKHWEEFSFSASGEQIAAKSITLSPENRWLVASQPDGGNVQFVENMGENAHKVKVDWSPNRKVVALSSTGESLGSDRQEILLVGLHGENFKSIVVEGRGMQSEWSPSGQQLLYSVYSARSEFKPELWIVNADGDNIGTSRRPLSLNTWAEKCSFADERFVYCAVPNELEVGSGFQPALAETTPDQIFRIDLRNGSKSTIAMDGAHTIDNIFVSADGKTLHFTDKLQDGLFKIEL